MLHEAPSSTLIVLRHNTPISRHNVKEAVMKIGREADNHIVLPDSSVSRYHAELRTGPEGASIHDLQSRNGIKVNGAPRAQAQLFDGDMIEVGAFALQYRTQYVPAPAPLRPELKNALAQTPANALHQTIVQRPALPDIRDARHLATLYHTCFWATEGMDEPTTNARMLPLLLEGFRACEVQLYGENGKLEASERAGGGSKPGMKFAPYLAERCAQLTEATPYSAAELARYQQRSGRFHYLVAPLRDPRQAPGEKAPFVAILRTEECEPFSREDRVLIQAVSQLWARGTHRGRQMGALRHENAQLRAKASAAANATTPLVGTSAAINQLRTRLQRVAGTQAPVLLLGETGSGKEVAAQFVHQNSPRSDEAFIKVNCAAIPEGLIESELFGHVRGAFTDAKADRAGKFQQANGGTLFLDEVGELPPGVQSKLLRALETGEIQPLGSEKSIHVNVRIVAATNRDLAALVQGKQFREDLYYRLNVFAVRVPPLREHLDDLPALAEGFLNRFCKENGLAALRFSAKAHATLATHGWPGNVRELRNIVQRCALECDGSEIGPKEVTAVLPASV